MDVNDINESNLQVILDYLDKIATKLNIGVHEIWPWFIKQQFVDAYLSLGLFLATIVVASILAAVTCKLWRKESKYNKDTYYYNSEGERVDKEVIPYAYSIYHQNHELGWIWANGICIVVILLAGFLAYLQFFDIFNPEYSAFKDLITTVTTAPQ